MFKDYVLAGLSLCIVDSRAKAPRYKNWQKLPPIDADVADTIQSAGLMHVQSGTCALDIDNLSLARPFLAERGVDVDDLLKAPDAVRITSGRPGRAKLIYKMKRPLRTLKPTGSGIELRCATGTGTTVQDVLPPSVHPDIDPKTKQHYIYRWQYGEPLLGDWRHIPPIPSALKAAWKELLDSDVVPRANGHAPEDADILKLGSYLEAQDPNSDYETWIKVGMKLNDYTGGSDEGLALWDSWSSKATRLKQDGRPVYQPTACKIHWVSFSSTPGKHLATLDNELPADADEFEVIEETVAAATETPTETKSREAAKSQRKEAFKKLEERLVYVLASEKYFDTTRHSLVGSDSAIEHQFTSMMPLGKNGRMNPVRVLKSSTTKRQVEGLGFHPGEGALFKVGDDTYANQYRNRLPTPLEPTKLELEKIEWVFGRIEDEDYRNWLKQYYGHVVQKPAIKIKSAPLIWSDIQRNGKTTLLKAIPALLVGQEYSTDVSYALLNSDFNDYLQGVWHVNLTEFRAGTRGERTAISQKLKVYIADDMIPFHPKGSRGYSMPNHFFVTATSNEDDAAAIDNNDERWGIYEMKVPRFTQSERKWIYNEFLLTSRAAAVLRHYFLHINIEGFYAAGEAPMTSAKTDMADASLSSDEELLRSMFEERRGLMGRDVVLVSEVADYVRKHSVAKPTAHRVARILAKRPFNGTAIQFRSGQGRYRAMVVRNHKQWIGASGKVIKDHIDNEEIDLLE